MTRSIIKYLVYALCLIGLIPATLFSLFGFFASNELIPYNWIFRIMYLLAFLSCSVSIFYMFCLILSKDIPNQIANTPLKRIGIAVTIFGLLVTFSCMILMLLNMYGFSSIYPYSETYSWLYVVLVFLSGASCIYIGVRFLKILRDSA